MKIINIGNSKGVILSPKDLEHLGANQGDELSTNYGPDGQITLRPYDDQFEEMLSIAEEGMAKYRNTLKKLAE